MKSVSMLLVVAALLGFSAPAFCESNPLAVGLENVTKAPMTLLHDGNESLFTPVKDIDRPILGFADNARAAVVSVGLNLGQPVEK